MSPRKHKLSLSIDENFCLLGMVSDEPDYKLCFLLNEKAEAIFQRMDNLVLYDKKSDAEQEFSLFQFNNPKNLLTYRIIKNRSDTGFYLPELKNIDYLMHIQGEILESEIDHLIKLVSAMDQVRMCVPVDLSRVKNRDRLLLW